MGCDIHCYKEKFVDGNWISADEWKDEYNEGYLSVPFDFRFTERNYELFGLLSEGVRHDTPYAMKQRGLPFDVSPKVKAECERWDSDGHSHSYLYLFELQNLRKFLDAQTTRIDGMKDAKQLCELHASIASGNPDWNLLYPYCGGTNVASYVRFSLDIPAAFAVGKSLDRLIATFDADPVMQRLVFWFDN